MGSLNLKETPHNPIIIQGFPGFGLVGSIATEFLLEHLQTRLIGSVSIPELPAMVAVHNGKLIQPVGIYYDETHNIVIVHVVSNAQGLEQQLADHIAELVKRTAAQRIISIEGVATNEGETELPVMHWASSQDLDTQARSLGLPPLQEGIVIGLCSSLMLKGDLNLLALFAMVHSQLPDSKAAAEIIKVLDKMLGLDVDYQPLIRSAEVFEQKLKGILSQSQQVMSERDKKMMNYVG